MGRTHNTILSVVFSSAELTNFQFWINPFLMTVFVATPSSGDHFSLSFSVWMRHSFIHPIHSLTNTQQKPNNKQSVGMMCICSPSISCSSTDISVTYLIFHSRFYLRMTQWIWIVRIDQKRSRRFVIASLNSIT